MTNPNDSAAPKLYTSWVGENGNTYYDFDGQPFSKKEEALLRFMCAIVQSGKAILPEEIEYIKEYATELTEAYFNELNKQ